MPCTRRDVVRRLAVLGAAPALGGVVSGCARRIDTDRMVPASAPVDGVVTIPLASVPELAQPNGAVVLDVEQAWPVLVVATGTTTKYVAMYAICSHAGCTVAWVPDDKLVECPCHGSAFASDGTLLRGPATEGLVPFPVGDDGHGNLRLVIYPGDGTFPPVSGGKLTLELGSYPQLQQDGGYVEGRAQGFAYPLIVRNLGGILLALNADCPHLHCRVHVLTTELRCFCHGSEFKPDGAYIAGPALADLAKRTGVVSGGAVTFDLPV